MFTLDELPTKKVKKLIRYCSDENGNLVRLITLNTRSRGSESDEGLY